MAQMCGGASQEKQATAEIQSIIEEVISKGKLKDAIIKESGKDSFGIFKAITYTSQVVAGTNYFVKIQIDEGGECVHVRIFQPLPHTGGKCELNGVQKSKALGDTVEYF